MVLVLLLFLVPRGARGAYAPYFVQSGLSLFIRADEHLFIVVLVVFVVLLFLGITKVFEACAGEIQSQWADQFKIDVEDHEEQEEHKEHVANTFHIWC